MEASAEQFAAVDSQALGRVAFLEEGVVCDKNQPLLWRSCPFQIACGQ